MTRRPTDSTGPDQSSKPPTGEGRPMPGEGTDAPHEQNRRGLTRRSLLQMAAVGVAASAVSFGTGRFAAPGAELPDWTTADMPSQTGRRAVVTGANGYPREGRSGLGYHEALALAVAGADVTIASRNRERGEEAVRRIRTAAPGATVRFETLALTALRAACGAPPAAGPRVGSRTSSARRSGDSTQPLGNVGERCARLSRARRDLIGQVG